MLLIQQLFAASKTSQKTYKKLFTGIILLLVQAPVYALQIDSVAMRNMNSYNKFDSLSQSAVVIKTRENQLKYIDKIEFASGELSNSENSSFFISAGPSWHFNQVVARSGLAFIEFGISPTWISDTSFENKSLGGHVFFTSNLQLGMHFGRRHKLKLSLRIHHISNAGLSTKNPGADMLGVELSYLLGR